MIIKRFLETILIQRMQTGKVVILYGPRRAGKTFLLRQLQDSLSGKENILFLNGESSETQLHLTSGIPEKLASYLKNVSLLVIDEAQKIPQVGQALKLIVDTLPELKIIASGSASFELSQKTGEPLTGRKKTLHLFPVSASEIAQQKGIPHLMATLEERMIMGSYPELFSISDPKDQQEYLKELADSFLFKDVLEMENLRNSKKLKDLLILLAFQIGKEVSWTELANQLELNRRTVERYLDLLEKSFILINVRGYSRNLRKEVTKTSRYYFYDNGIRNALINQFNPLALRDDVGMLWENYIVSERLKKQSYDRIFSNNYFWRTYDQKEIDWVEEREGALHAYEIKWSGPSSSKSNPPKAWSKAYPHSHYSLIHRENFFNFII